MSGVAKATQNATKEFEEQRAEVQMLHDIINDGKEAEIYVEASKELAESLKNMFGNVAESIADTFIEAFVATGDAATDMGDVIQDVAKSIAKSLIMDKLLNDENGIFNKDFQDRIFGLMTSGNEEQANAEIAEKINQAESLAPTMNKILEAFGVTIDAAEEVASRTSASQSYAQASQDSVDKSLGILTNIENHTYDISGNVNEIADMMRKTIEIQQANTDASLGHLSAISDNTHRLHKMSEDLTAMRKELESVRGYSEDIADNTEKFIRG